MSPELKLENQTLTLHVTGDLISTNAESLRSLIGSSLDTTEQGGQKWTTFVLDLRAAKMVDSVGLNMVVTFLKRVQKLGGKMQVTYSSSDVARTFAFTRLDKQVGLVKV